MQGHILSGQTIYWSKDDWRVNLIAFTITQTQLEQMKNVNIQTVDRDSLVDIQTIQVGTSLPKNERILSFLENIKNPYCFKCGQMVVKVKFDEGSMTLQDRMIHYFQSVG